LPSVFTLRNISWEPTYNAVKVDWETDFTTTGRVEYSADPLFTANWETYGGFPYWRIYHQEGTWLSDVTRTAHSLTIPTTATIYFRCQSTGSFTATSPVYEANPGKEPPIVRKKTLTPTRLENVIVQTIGHYTIYEEG